MSLVTLPTLYTEIPLKDDLVNNDLEKIVVRLPINSVIDESDQITDPKKQFDSQLTGGGGVIQFVDSIVEQVSYRLLNDFKTIELSPILLNNNLNIKLCKIILKLPDFVLKNCISAIKLDNNTFILDILTQEGLFITLSFQSEDFTTTTTSISLENFKKWGKYDMPYSIDTRKPHSILTLSENLTIVPFIDGGLLQMRRHSKFDQIETTTFTDSSYLDSLTKFFKKTPDNEFIDNKISVRTVISAALLSDQYLVTLSINRKLKIWSFETNTTILEQELISSGSYFDLQPSQLIKIIDSPSTNEFRLATLIPLKDRKIIIWSLAISNNQCLLQEDFKILPPKRDETNWLTQSYQIYKVSPNELKLFLLWRSNTLKKILSCDVNLQTNEYSWIVSKEKLIVDQPDPASGLHFAESINEYYLAKISKDYNSIILNTVLGIFESHYQYTSSNSKLLSSRILDVIQYNLDPESLGYLVNLKNQWSKFDGSCKELLKQSYEPIDLVYNGKADMIYVLKSYGISVLKKSSFIELLTYNPHTHLPSEFINISHTSVNSTNLSQLVTLARDFKSLFANEALDELKYSIAQFDEKDLDSVMASMFDEILSPNLSEDLINQLLARLGSISNVLEVIELFCSNVHEINKFVSSKLSNFGSSLLHESFKNAVILYEEFTLGLILIMLVMENNDQVKTFFTRLVTKFQSLKLVSTVVNLSDETLFNSIIFKQFQVEGFKLSDSDTLNDILSSILSYVLTSDSFLINIIVQLLSKGEVDKIIKYDILNFLSNDKPIHVFLKGITYLKLSKDDKAFKILTSKAETFVNYNLSPREANDLDLISSLSLVFGSSLMKYYVTLTNLFIEHNYIKNAYSLAKLAIKNYDADYDEDLKDSDTVYWNLFQLSLKLSDYDRSFKTINQLSPSLKLKSIRIFVLHLLDTKSIGTLLQYNFKENISVVDSIILELARQQDFLINSLNYYKILYSWRLSFNDKRGAAEALYQFINKFEKTGTEQLNNKSFDLRSLYIIILNVVKTIKESEDQWIIKQIDGAENTVVTFDELEKEFNKKF